MRLGVEYTAPAPYFDKDVIRSGLIGALATSSYHDDIPEISADLIARPHRKL